MPLKTRIEQNALKIVKIINAARAAGDRLGTIYCCVEAEFMRQGHGCEMEFQTAARWLMRKNFRQMA